MSKHNDPVRAAAIADDYRSGMFYRAIIAKHRVGPEKLKRILTEAGLYNSRRPDYSNAPKAEIAADYSAGVPFATMQEKYKVSRDAIYDIVKELDAKSGYRFPEHEEASVVSDYRAGVPSQEICKAKDINPVVFYRILHEAGVACDRREKVKRLDHVAVIADYRAGDPMDVLGERYSVSRASIARLLAKHEVVLRSQSEARRQYALDETYFDDINLPDRAYYLGFLWADGCNKTYDNTVQIILSRKDEDMLVNFRAAMKSEGIIRHYVQRTVTGKLCEYSDYCIYSQRVSKRLEELGMVRAKTYAADLGLPKGLRPEMLRHFVRGLIDGDGCIWLSKRGAFDVNVSAVGHPTILTTIHEALKEIDVTSTIVRLKLVNPDRCHTKQLNIGGNRNAVQFLQWLYKDSQGIRLTRKYGYYQECVRRYFTEIKGNADMNHLNFTHA